MSDALDRRLNRIFPTITSDVFLKGTGLGNEIAFHIFDYPPEEEIRVRKHIQWLLEQLSKQKPGLRVQHINLFNFVIEHIRNRGFLERAFEIQREKGDKKLRDALKGPLHEEKMAREFAKIARPEEHDLVLVSGVGSVYPLLRTHTLLSNLHGVMGQVPMVLFYPGRYDGTSLRLFGKSTLSVGSNSAGGKKQDSYYRAFRLIPEETTHAH